MHMHSICTCSVRHAVLLYCCVIMQCYLPGSSEQKVIAILLKKIQILILQEKYKENQNLIIQLIEPTDWVKPHIFSEAIWFLNSCCCQMFRFKLNHKRALPQAPGAPVQGRCMGPVHQQHFFLYLATLCLSLIKYYPSLPVLNILTNWITAEGVNSCRTRNWNHWSA